MTIDLESSLCDSALLDLLYPKSDSTICLERFSGECGDCRPFISQCKLHFEFNAASFSSDRVKIAFIFSHLTGRARSWATAEWSRRSAMCNSLPEFLKIFTQIQSTYPAFTWEMDCGLGV
uniref:DUF4939 domain-containing protein n=1 Tax=Mola mola TaxID=94237 RepID=A0A3Q3WCW3_MOLML